MTPREKDIYILAIFLVLVLFSSIGLLCTTIHVFNWCERKYCRKEIRFVRNHNENRNPII